MNKKYKKLYPYFGLWQQWLVQIGGGRGGGDTKIALTVSVYDILVTVE